MYQKPKTICAKWHAVLGLLLGTEALDMTPDGIESALFLFLLLLLCSLVLAVVVLFCLCRSMRPGNSAIMVPIGMCGCPCGLRTIQRPISLYNCHLGKSLIPSDRSRLCPQSRSKCIGMTLGPWVIWTPMRQLGKFNSRRFKYDRPDHTPFRLCWAWACVQSFSCDSTDCYCGVIKHLCVKQTLVCDRRFLQGLPLVKRLLLWRPTV